MWCIACGTPAQGMCGSCAASMRPGHTRFVAGALASAAFAHQGAAARLVRLLKYRRSMTAASFLAVAMGDLLPVDAACLVPVPRALVRRARYGIDPSRVLASAISASSGVPVHDALRGPWWWPQRAGRGRHRRSAVRFTSTMPVPPGAVLIDDVLTTGATMRGALHAANLEGASTLRVLTATSVGSMGHGATTAPNLGGDVASKRRSSALRPVAGPATAPPPHAHPRKESE